MDAHTAYLKVMEEMSKHIAGKKETLELLFLSIIANGHALLEGVPGVAKTTMTKALASIIDADFKRIQGTPDLEPKDIIGYTYIDSDNSIKVKKGPIFTNILLIDELNRAPPKTMSAFLEALEERQVSLGGTDIPLPKPFTAFATQNPLRIEGTEPLPKVMADRFIMRIEVDYPSMEEEGEMLRIKEREEKIAVNKILTINDILDMQEQAKNILLPDDVVKYITAIVDATRKDIHVVMGASPRADIAFMACGKAKALVEGRKEVTIDDIRFLAKPVLSHRIAVRATGGIGVNGIIDGILASIKI
ncbi:MAG: MoxR family ATPase [Candidatus Micrarchaeota archaeon]